jgi:hypothetical protein
MMLYSLTATMGKDEKEGRKIGGSNSNEFSRKYGTKKVRLPLILHQLLVM